MPHGTNEKTTLQTTVRLFFHISAQAECLHSRLCGYMKKISVYADARLLLSAVGGIIYRRSLFVLPTVDSKVLGTCRTGAHRHRVADAIDFVAIAITLAMLATSPTTSRVLALEIVWIYEKK